MGVYFRDLTSHPADQVAPVKRGPSVEKLVSRFKSCIIMKFLSFCMNRERFSDNTNTLALGVSKNNDYVNVFITVKHNS
jgi:hypothetical protein